MEDNTLEYITLYLAYKFYTVSCLLYLLVFSWKDFLSKGSHTLIFPSGSNSLVWETAPEFSFHCFCDPRAHIHPNSWWFYNCTNWANTNFQKWRWQNDPFKPPSCPHWTYMKRTAGYWSLRTHQVTMKNCVLGLFIFLENYFWMFIADVKGWGLQTCVGHW